jgi:hypothetical protein
MPAILEAERLLVSWVSCPFFVAFFRTEQLYICTAQHGFPAQNPARNSV